MGLQMGRIDHQLIRLPTLGSQRSEYLVEHAEPAPSDEAVVDRLGWAVFGRRVTPAQAIPDHEDDTAHDPPIVDPRYTVRQREIRLNPAHLRLRQPNQIARSEEHTSELQSLMRHSYAVFCLKKKKTTTTRI